MTEQKRLTVADFKDATVYSCGLDNRDPQRGYRKEVPVQESLIAGLVKAQETVRTPEAGNER